MVVRTASKAAEINKTTIATSWAIKNEENKNRLEEKDISDQYKEFTDVFSEEKAK